LAATLIGAAASGFSSSAMGAAFQGATFWQTMGTGITGGMMSTAIAGITYGIGGIGGINIAFQKLNEKSASMINGLINLSARSVAHGVFQGGTHLIQGCRFEHGFLSGFFSSFALGSMSNVNMGSVGSMVFGATIGGTAEALGGGKFANGAVTGAYVMMFNHLNHEWHQTRTGAAKSAAEKTTTTGNETSVLVYQDDSGELCYWECPHDPRNSPTSAYWVEPPGNEISGLTLVEEFHYSVKHGVTNEGKPGLMRGSFQDWQNARDFNIRVTHHTIDVGSWIFTPTLFFSQPPAIIYMKYILWNIEYPIPSPDWYIPKQ
jgi:hypothetical protein